MVRFAGGCQRAHERGCAAFTRGPGPNQLEVTDKHPIEDRVVNKAEPFREPIPLSSIEQFGGELRSVRRLLRRLLAYVRPAGLCQAPTAPASPPRWSTQTARSTRHHRCREASEYRSGSNLRAAPNHVSSSV